MQLSMHGPVINEVCKVGKIYHTKQSYSSRDDTDYDDHGDDNIFGDDDRDSQNRRFWCYFANAEKSANGNRVRYNKLSPSIK